MEIFRISKKTPGLRASGVFLFCVLLLACTIHHPDILSGHQTSAYISDVPFHPGEEFQCGPSVLASVLNYLGHDIRPDEISGEIYLKGIRGTLNFDMVNFAQRFGDVSVKEFSGDLELLKKEISAGHPLIVFVDLGIWSIRKGHYMLVVGYDDRREGMIVYSGADRDKVIGYDKFMRMWERGGYWALRLTGEFTGDPS